MEKYGDNVLNVYRLYDWFCNRWKFLAGIFRYINFSEEFMLEIFKGNNILKSDNYGRKRAITTFCFMLGGLLILHSVVPTNYIIFSLFRIAEMVCLVGF